MLFRKRLHFFLLTTIHRFKVDFLSTFCSICLKSGKTKPIVVKWPCCFKNIFISLYIYIYVCVCVCWMSTYKDVVVTGIPIIHLIWSKFLPVNRRIPYPVCAYHLRFSVNDTCDILVGAPIKCCDIRTFNLRGNWIGTDIEHHSKRQGCIQLMIPTTFSQSFFMTWIRCYIIVFCWMQFIFHATT